MWNKLIYTFLFSVMILTSRGQVNLKEFTSPPNEYKPVPLWFWNNSTLEETELIDQFRNFITKDGYGGCAILPFGKDFRPVYLSEEYFRLYGKVIEEARQMGMQMSIYDEYGFPSGSMGAINGDDTPRFMNKYPDATIKRLDKTEYKATAGTRFEKVLPEGKLMSVVAMDTITKQRLSLLPYLNRGTVRWDVPAGSWKVLCFVCVKDGDPNVDYLDPEAVKLFIAETHQQYYDRFSKDFGTVITETFFDEPTMYRAEGRMWTYCFNEKFIRQYGFSPELLYPALWEDIGEETRSARNYLFGFRSQLYAEGFMKTIQEWAAEHGILSTGHQDNEEIMNPVSVSGDLMLCGKYMDIPGIDKIGGNRPSELYYKVVSSSANNWDKNWVMSETYGAMGNIPVEEMYYIAMEQYTKGITHLIPHAVWYNDKRVTFLPELSYRNELYRDHLPAFNGFLTRLNYLLRREGRHVADIAMLYPVHSLQGEHYLDGKEGFYKGGVIIPDVDYTDVSSILTDSIGKDFTYLHPEVLDQKCTIQDDWLCLENRINKEQFRVIIVPGMKTISLTNLQKILAFKQAGGDVLFTTQLPIHSVEFNQDKEVTRIIKEILQTSPNKKAGKAIFIAHPSAANIRQALDSLNLIYDVSFPEGKELRYIHKICDEHSIYYMANLRSTPCETEVIVRGEIKPLLLDPHTDQQTKATYTNETESGIPVTKITLQLKANSSMFIVESE